MLLLYDLFYSPQQTGKNKYFHVQMMHSASQGFFLKKEIVHGDTSTCIYLLVVRESLTANQCHIILHISGTDFVHNKK